MLPSFKHDQHGQSNLDTITLAGKDCKTWLKTMESQFLNKLVQMIRQKIQLKTLTLQVESQILMLGSSHANSEMNFQLLELQHLYSTKLQF